MVAFLLTGGIISDRVERRRVLIGAHLVRAAVLLTVGVDSDRFEERTLSAEALGAAQRGQ